MRQYEGVRTEDGVVEVRVDSEPLNPRFDLRNHSPTGFEFGYGGSGPSQLALAILADALGNDEQAQQYYQKFKREKISRLSESPWVITQEEVRGWIASLLKSPEQE